MVWLAACRPCILCTFSRNLQLYHPRMQVTVPCTNENHVSNFQVDYITCSVWRQNKHQNYKLKNITPPMETTGWQTTPLQYTPFNGPLSGTTRVSRYQKGKNNLDLTEARDSEWQWHQLGHKQVCILLQTDNHATRFSQAECPSCHPTNSVKSLKAKFILVYLVLDC